MVKRKKGTLREECTDFTNRKVGSELLANWRENRLLIDRQITGWEQGDPRVTLLTYYFWAEDPEERNLNAIECAILQTWRHCGRMRTIIVTDRLTPPLEKLASTHSSWIDIQIEPSLKSGNLYSMSVDCNSRLHQRFETDYVLIVQDDGFPLRPGLDEFVGPYDFIGAPYVRNKWYLQTICRLFKCQVCNGGFSLRSRKICKLASHYWNKKYHKLPNCDLVSEDLFYTKTLPIRESAYRRSVKTPSFEEAMRFSYDAVFPYQGNEFPFGFHGALAFKLLQSTRTTHRENDVRF